MSLAMFLILLLRLYSFVLFVSVILSWLNLSEDNQIVVLVRKCTEPVLEPIRRVLPPFGGFDLSPLVALFVLQLVQRLLTRF